MLACTWKLMDDSILGAAGMVTSVTSPCGEFEVLTRWRNCSPDKRPTSDSTHLERRRKAKQFLVGRRLDHTYLLSPSLTPWNAVSAAAGAVGQIVCQLAKREGLKVIASAGDDQKVKFLREELGVDVAWNYKTESTEEKLKANPFHIFFDNGASIMIPIMIHG